MYKEIRHIAQFGDFYRLLSPFEGNETAWIFVTEDKREAFASFFRVMAQPHPNLTKVKLQGLNLSYTYEVLGQNTVASGDELMYRGVDTSNLYGDFASRI